MESVVLPAVGHMVTNVIQNSVSGFVEAGTRSIGGYAGDFIIKGGDYVESIGRGVGERVALRGELWGDSIKGYYTPGPNYGKGPIQSRPLAVRSKSLPSFLPAAGPGKTNSGAGDKSSSTQKKALPQAVKKQPVSNGKTARATAVSANKSGGLPSSTLSSFTTTTVARVAPAAKKAVPVKPASSTTTVSSSVKATAKPLAKPVAVSKPAAPKSATASISPSSKTNPVKKVVPEKRSLPQYQQQQRTTKTPSSLNSGSKAGTGTGGGTEKKKAVPVKK